MGTPRVLPTLSSPCSATPLLSRAHPWPLQNPNSPLSLNPHPTLHLPSCFRSKFRPWDSNAEAVRNRNFEFDFEDGGDEEEDDGVRSRSRGKENSRFLEEVIDDIWFLKVLSSYGWLLPGIILSMLAVSGPKAFLMALALPLGQSALFLALKKLWATINGSSKRSKPRVRKRRSSSKAATANVKRDEEGRRGSEARRKKAGYRSWVARGNGSVGSGGDVPAFGGWEELDEEFREFDRGSIGRRTAGSPERKSMEGGKFRKKGRGEAPLLLRLLVAVFPFLGSWTKVL